MIFYHLFLSFSLILSFFLAAVLISLVALMLQIHFHPFVDEIDDELASFALLQTLLTLFVALCVQSGIDEEDGWSEDNVGIALIVLSVLGFSSLLI